MQGKKSINVTDILPYHSISKISHFSTIDTAFGPAKSITKQFEKKQSGHHFLSKIKGQIGSLKLKKQNRYDEKNSIQLDNNNSGQAEYLSRQKIDENLHRIENFSPFKSEQKLYENIYHRQMQNILEEKQRHRNCFRYKTLIEKKKVYKQKQILNHSNEGRKTAKVTELNAQFNKIKLFQKQLNLTTTLTNLNPYQLSQKRKNLNLIKMRLGSLGYKADEDEKNQYNALQKLMQENQHKKWLHSNFKHKQLLKGLYQQSKKQACIQKRTRTINEKDQSRKQINYSSIRRENSKNVFQIASKTIQIHQIQRNGTKTKGQYLSRSNQKQKKIINRGIVRIQ